MLVVFSAYYYVSTSITNERKKQEKKKKELLETTDIQNNDWIKLALYLLNGAIIDFTLEEAPEHRRSNSLNSPPKKCAEDYLL